MSVANTTENLKRGLKPFDKDKALAGHPVVTRDGQPVDNVVDNGQPKYSLTATINGNKWLYTDAGTYWLNPKYPHSLDLFMLDTSKG